MQSRRTPLSKITESVSIMRVPQLTNREGEEEVSTRSNASALSKQFP